MGKKKQAEPPSENYTIFHALVEALRDKDKEDDKDKGIFSRFRLRK